MELANQIKGIVGKCNESQTELKIIVDDMPNVDQGIVQTETIKYHVCYTNNSFP